MLNFESLNEILLKRTSFSILVNGSRLYGSASQDKHLVIRHPVQWSCLAGWGVGRMLLCRKSRSSFVRPPKFTLKFETSLESDP